MAPPKSRGLFRGLALTVAAVAGLAIVSHLLSLFAGFIWLDHGDIEQGAAIAEPAGWLSLFWHGYARTGFYRPLVALSLSIDALSGRPFVFHLTSLVLHAAVAVALLFAGESLGFSRRTSALGAALFAVHPVTSLVANGIVFRGESLAALGLLGLIIGHQRRRPLVAALALLVGALSKETALVLGPLFILALSLTSGGKDDSAKPAQGWSGVASLWAAEAAAFALALGLRLGFGPAWHPSAPALGLSATIGTRLATVLRSAQAIAWPFDARVCDAFAPAGVLDVRALAGAAVLLGLLLLAWRRRGAGTLLLLAVLPSLQVVPAPRFWSPHYLYLAWALGSLLVADLLVSRARAGALLAGVSLAALVALSFVEARRYRDDSTFWASEVAGHPECREGQLYLGDAKRHAGDLEGAAEAYTLAAEPAPGFIAYGDQAAALQNLGLVRLEQGRYFDAEIALEQALERQRDERSRRQLVHDLAAVAVARGDPAGAEQLLRPEAERPDAMPESITLLSRALREMGREAEADNLLRRTGRPP